MIGSPPPQASDARAAGVLLNEYQLRLPGFEGPLDTLLRLIERDQLPIAALSLIQVTAQFLAVVRSLGREGPPELLADFAVVGARLTLIKSRSLLPRSPSVDHEPEPGDLVRQLLRYRAIRDTARHFADRDVVDHAVFPPASRPVAGAGEPAVVRLMGYTPGILTRAIRRRLSQLAEPARVLPAARIVSLREMVVRFAGQLVDEGGVRFSRLTATCQNRHEVQTAFLAGLVLIRRGMAEAEQAELFGEIEFRTITAPGGEYLSGLSGDVTADFDPERSISKGRPVGAGVLVR